MSDDSYRVLAWALDFVRAARSAGLIRRILFRLIMNRHMAKEFGGLMNALSLEGYWPYYDYDLEDWDSRWPAASWAWWREKPAVPLTKAE